MGFKDVAKMASDRDGFMEKRKLAGVLEKIDVDPKGYVKTVSHYFPPIVIFVIDRKAPI